MDKTRVGARLSSLVGVGAWLFCAAPASMAYTAAEADYTRDRAAIMALGNACMVVDYSFEEVESLEEGYKVDPRPYATRAIEWVEAEERAPGVISLQHILILPNGSLKHWREEWEYERPFVHSFAGNKTWQREYGSAEGAWTQRVFRTDDEPRYECMARWTHDVEGGGNAAWACRANSPLPRREYTHRSDYQILERGNTIRLTDAGYEHVQDNIKVRLTTEGGAVPRAREHGLNVYRRAGLEACDSARAWWNAQRQSVWRGIQGAWEDVAQHASVYSVMHQEDGTSLRSEIAALAARYEDRNDPVDEGAVRSEARSLLDRWLVVTP